MEIILGVPLIYLPIITTIPFVAIGGFLNGLSGRGSSGDPHVLLARWLSVGGTIIVLRMRRAFTQGVVHIITWAGLRGGLSVAMALSLPSSPPRDVILDSTKQNG